MISSYFSVFFLIHTFIPEFPKTLFFYLILFPNIPFVMHLQPSLSLQLWSIGVEEQFYLIWPVMLKFSKKRLVVKFLAVIAGTVFLRKIFSLLTVTYGLPREVTDYVERCRFDSMAIGACGAYLIYYEKKRALKILYHPLIQITAILLPWCATWFCMPFPLDDTVFYSLFFAITILNVTSNPHSLLKLENKSLDFLGKISYGIYCYHLIVLHFFVIYMRKYFQIEMPVINALAMYAFVCTMTIIVSCVSYLTFEKYFLNLKRYFCLVDNQGARFN
ncbi:MAG: acyltransferase [Candidatus Omnitrophica bacterium]|nr:acyltransferase [Candidatus Omnitrophota bacterium]